MHDELKAKRAEQVFECRNCGCQHFYLLAAGDVQCRVCQQILPSLVWGLVQTPRKPV